MLKLLHLSMRPSHFYGWILPVTLNPKPLNRLTFNRREGPLDPKIRISTPKMPTVSLSIPDFHLPPALHAKTPQHGVGVGVQQN